MRDFELTTDRSSHHAPACVWMEHECLSIRVEQDQSELCIVELYGAISPGSAEFLAVEMRRLEAGGADEMVVDISALELLDSTGLRVLQDSHARRQEVSRRIIFLRGGRTDGALSDGELDSLLPFAD